VKELNKYSISPKSGRLRKKIRLDDAKKRQDFDNSKRNNRIVVIGIFFFVLLSMYLAFDFISSAPTNSKEKINKVKK
jgi:hypothetical protein